MAAMFFIYLWRELRRRVRQAVIIAFGLALGVGLVITVTAASAGVQNAQSGVLHSLYGVGTDVTVTQPPAKGASASISFGFHQEVQKVRSGQIAAGTKIDDNELINSQYGTIDAGSVAAVARQPGVAVAGGALALTDFTVTGTVPAIGAGGGTFSSSFTTHEVSVDGVEGGNTIVGPLSSGRITAGKPLPGDDAAADDAVADDAVADSGYAAANGLHPGSTVNVGGTTFTVVGIVSVPQGGNPPDLYIPLAKAQSISSSKLAGKVNTIYVSAASATDIGSVQREIARLLPGATVTDSSDLAGQVTGSLSSASSLASSLGTWLSIAVLIAAFGIASLLTMAAVTRRVREFGTLKALGWRSRRIVGQVLGESVAIGLAGGAAGVGLGYLGAALIGKLAPKLSATVGTSPPASTGSGVASSLLKGLSSTASHTVLVTLTAPVAKHVIVLAVALAVAGGLLAGLLGGWRAARLRPAAALTRVE
jgi:putative ABC transport system permease protein